MKFQHQIIMDDVHLLTFEKQVDLASTFLRFQEHYESPRFKGEIFSLDEYKDWYIRNSPEGQKSGNFTYYSDWDGFNIPSVILDPFCEGKFDPLSDAEKEILVLFENEERPFYVIGIHTEGDEGKKIVDHEVAHGLFYTNTEYKEKVTSVISKYNTADIKKELIKSGGYSESVLDDEIHAYCIAGSDDMGIEIPTALMAEIQEVFKQYSNKTN